jgi:hypothetical protein
MPDSLEDKLKTVSAEVVTDEFQNGSESPAGDVSSRVRRKLLSQVINSRRAPVV